MWDLLFVAVTIFIFAVLTWIIRGVEHLER
jgi:hypothetical protein